MSDNKVCDEEIEFLKLAGYFEAEGESTSTLCLDKGEQSQRHKQALINTTREIKALENQKLKMLSAMTDKEKQRKLFESVCKAHKGILEIDGGLDFVLSSCFEDELDQLEWFLANRHSRFFKSADVFKLNESNEFQKKLVKDGAICLRGLKKSKTANQHITYMHTGKEMYSRQKKLEQQLDELEKRLAMNEQLTTSLATQQVSLSEFVKNSSSSISSDIQDIKNIVTRLSGKVTDTRKVTAYVLLTSDKRATHKSVGEVLNVSTKTIQRWLSEIEKLVGEMDTEVDKNVQLK